MYSTSAFVLLLVAPLSFAEAATYPPYATVASGVLIGTTTTLPSATATVNQFLGVPFAASPVRFSPPTEPTAWSQPINATEWKPACIQQFNYPELVRNFTMAIFNNPPPAESEDCLYLNVYAPSSLPPLGGFPVMVWYYGGSLQFGNAGQQYYDGSSFAAYQDVIIVTTNYRTNIFGFPSSPELPLNQRNLGFLDQRYALSWVQDNIRAFNGNPEKVTIFGESAGAVSVDAMVNSWPHDPPFRAAIMQSGQQSLRGFLNLGVDVTKNWFQVAAALNCSQATSNLTCLRDASASALKSVIEHAALSFQPIVDNVTLIGNPTAAKEANNVANVSILAGTNAQEGRVFEYGQTNLTAFLQSLFPGQEAYQNAVAQAYPVGSGNLFTAYDAISAIYTDLVFTCPQSIQVSQTAAAGYPAWRYVYNATFPNIQPVPNLGVFHSSEIPIVWGTYPANYTAQEYALSRYVQGAWASFAKNPTLGPGWNPVGTFDGVDAGILGANGSAGVTVVDESVVDSKCGIFAPVYAVVDN